VIDITDTFLKKSAAMNKFTSQHYSENSQQQRKLGEALDGGISAIHSRVAYAEAFVADNPEVYEYLPVSDYRRQFGTMSPEEASEYRIQMLLD
jgi:hypothetical protein